MKKFPIMRKSRGFTLVETVIAIGVLAVLLTGFVIVFAPAAAGIKVHQRAGGRPPGIRA